MIYAQIKNNMVYNCIVLNNEALVDRFLPGYDVVLRVDELEPRPQIGWLYNDGVFTEAPLPEEMPEEG